MQIFSTITQQLHAPQFEFFRGERVPCFETPSRINIILKEVAARGHQVTNATLDSQHIIECLHSPRYISFLQNAWPEWLRLSLNNVDKQPFPAVWPVRTLRTDRVPENFIAKLGFYSMDNGTPISAGTWLAAKNAADAAYSAADFINQGAHSAFCVTRPPGHHAGYDFMGGYCFINNAGIATEALRKFGCSRVAILDVDYHHGNGTQSLFYERCDVFFTSIHGDPRTEYPFFLGYEDEKGLGEGFGYNLNLPLPAGSTQTQWFNAFDHALNAIRRYQPDALVVSLGLDAYCEDPISTFALSHTDYLTIGKLIGRLNRPTIFILEGGYAVTALGINAANVLEGFENS